jgi:hypothetical protein
VDVEAAAAIAAEVVSATATTPALEAAGVEVEEVLTTVLEMMEPVTVTVTGTLQFH